jgi:hypothetical protein
MAVTGNKSIKNTPMTGGGTIRTAFPRDHSGSHDLPNTMGKELGGSPTNLAHSLSGASAVQRDPSAKPRGGGE